MKTYEIKYEPVTVEGVEYPKYNIYYSDGGKEFHSTDGINGKIKDGYTNVNAPNFYGLEQDLFDLLLTTMQAYAQTYNDKGLLFTQTLTNGKRGEVINQQRLLMGLSLMGISFTDSDKEQINTAFERNNFSIRLS